MKKLALLFMVSLMMTVSLAAQDDPNTPQSEPKNEPAKDINAANPVVKMATTKGDIYIELYVDKAPITAKNFLKYTKDGFYNETIFHRVIKSFMIQGGGFTLELQKKKTNPPIKNESYNKIRNKRGTIAMARTNAPDSATSQFFINHKDNKSLDFDGPYEPGYAVFGNVIKGMNVVDAIANTRVRAISQAFQHLPVEPITITKVTVLEASDVEKLKAEIQKKTEKKDHE